MNGPKWVQEALRLTEQAGRWEDADRGWKAHLSTEERLAFRRADLQEALVYAHPRTGRGERRAADRGLQQQWSDPQSCR